MFDFAPLYVTPLLLVLVMREIVADAKKGVWDLFDIGVVFFTLCVLVWWIIIKIKGVA